ncbi:unnamed protein product [Thlaspi arvense]|uniref:F-box associated beta-propeller type 3 domain-containing protein n=1 Tax=Thlaspi arvense TaxID=13288 RepID=A0AAU9SSQ3_THLAR|nr:unnamed protein product [Thlaspi arvense]
MGSLAYDYVHGLVYMEYSTQLTIWNPTMNRFFTLPKPEGIEGIYGTGYLGYDPLACKYKILCIITGEKFGVLTLGAQESWRILSEGAPKHWYGSSCVLCINGVIYYEGSFGVEPQTRAIMSFDLRSEKFHLIKYPNDDFRGS